jgi:hypothetical protein
MLRTFIAVVGASIITVLLLLAMNEFTGRFRESDGKKYFLVDFIKPIEEGRQRVKRLEVPESTTQRFRPDVGSSATELSVDRPSVTEPALGLPPAAAPPEIDPDTIEQ